jgi:hypothetical protein
MNRQQKDQISGLVDAFDPNKFKESVAEVYKDLGDYSGISIGDIDLGSYIILVCKVYDHFRQEITSENFITLPFSYNFPDYGSGNLASDLTSISSYLQRNDFHNAFSLILRLAIYQRAYGFWEYNERRYLKSSEKKIQNDNELLEAKKALIDARIASLDELVSAIQSSHDKLDGFNEDSISKIKSLESALQNIISNNDMINNVYNNATTTAEKINSQLTLSESKKNDLDRLLAKANEQVDEINKSIAEYKGEYGTTAKKFEDLTNDFNEKLEFVEGKHEYFTERNSYLDDLIGREVGASLFETFKQRKNELSPSVTFWKWAVPCLAVATVAWIFLLFHWSSDKEMSYQLLIINSIKALPAIGLLLFGIAQYGKERNFQEEYAFKSAVALTLNSYAEQLKNIENKDALILASVSSIYKSPIFHAKIKLDDGKGVMDSLSELIGRVRDTGAAKK